MSMAIEARLQEIADVLNNDLIPQTFRLNGWTDTEYPTFTYGNLNEIDLEEFSKAVQRIFSVNAIEADRPVMNKIRTAAFKVDPLPDDEPVHKDELPNNESGASEGMSTMGEGTGTSAMGSSDNSADNLDNAG